MCGQTHGWWACATRHMLRSADPRWEPCALIARARFCAGGRSVMIVPTATGRLSIGLLRRLPTAAPDSIPLYSVARDIRRLGCGPAALWRRRSFSVACVGWVEWFAALGRLQTAMVCPAEQQEPQPNLRRSRGRLWGRMESCAAVGNRRKRPIDNRPQVNNLPHIRA